MNTIRVSALWFCLVALTLGGAGCSSTSKKAPGFLASIRVDNHSRDEIQRAVEQVFAADQWELYRGGLELVFDKKAGSVETVAYSSWSGKGVYSRAKVTIKNDGVGGYIVGCNPYVVHDRGDPTFEEEQKLFRLSGGEYKKLLDEVKKRLTP